MQKIREKLSKLLKKLQFRFLKLSLPQGKEEFEAFFSEFVEVYGFPRNDSFRQMIAMMIQHLPNGIYAIRPHVLFIAVRRAIANEVAYYVLKEIKENSEKAKAANAATVQ